MTSEDILRPSAALPVTGAFPRYFICDPVHHLFIHDLFIHDLIHHLHDVTATP